MKWKTYAGLITAKYFAIYAAMMQEEVKAMKHF
jgi:hypothetical protein